MKANRTISKSYQGVTYTFTKQMIGYIVSDGHKKWIQSTASVREAKNRRDN